MVAAIYALGLLRRRADHGPGATAVGVVEGERVGPRVEGRACWREGAASLVVHAEQRATADERLASTPTAALIARARARPP